MEIHPVLDGFVMTEYVSDSLPLNPSGADHETTDVESPAPAATDMGGHGRPSVDPEYSNRLGERDARGVGYVTAHPVAFTLIQFHT